jgi:hypothetical protein
MNGPKHKQQRSLVMPPFQKKAVASYHNLIVGPVWMFPVNLTGTPYHRRLLHAEELKRAVLPLIDKRRRTSGNGLTFSQS